MVEFFCIYRRLIWIFCVLEAPLPDGAVNCTNFAHVDANKWIAAFRSIYVKPWPKQIMVDFIAAPPQYCFEAYELRLMKSHHTIISSTIVPKEYLYEEVYGNITVMFGNHTFDNVAPGFYDIAVRSFCFRGIFVVLLISKNNSSCRSFL